jgi:hypothetical protein
MTAARAASDALTLALLSLAERGLRTHFGAHIIETGTHSPTASPPPSYSEPADPRHRHPPQPVTERACVRGAAALAWWRRLWTVR